MDYIHGISCNFLYIFQIFIYNLTCRIRRIIIKHGLSGASFSIDCHSVSAILSLWGGKNSKDTDTATAELGGTCCLASFIVLSVMPVFLFVSGDSAAYVRRAFRMDHDHVLMSAADVADAGAA